MSGVTVDFALLLFDEFDGAAISDVNVLFFAGGRALRPLRKREGYYVFTQLGVACPEIEIARPRYHPYRIRVDRTRLPPGMPVVSVRLLRQHSSAFGDCAWLAADAPPDSQVLALGKTPAFQLHAARQEAGVPTITITGGSLARLPGRRFAATGATDTFVVERQLSPGCYAVSGWPQKTPKARQFVRAHLNRSDGAGRALIPLEPTDAGYPDTVHFYSEEKKKWVPVCATALP